MRITLCLDENNPIHRVAMETLNNIGHTKTDYVATAILLLNERISNQSPSVSSVSDKSDTRKESNNALAKEESNLATSKLDDIIADSNLMETKDRYTDTDIKAYLLARCVNESEENW